MNASIVMMMMAACNVIPMPREYAELKGTSRAEIAETTDASIAAEGYRLEVTPEKISIASSDDRGAFYARKTLEQLKRPDGSYPCVKIADAPRFPYRGLMIDDGRHFFGKAFVLKELELMARYKLNRLHWHLTEDQGWRIQIDCYPELTKTGATRVQTAVRGRYTGEYDGRQYGPYFYTKDEIREVVRRAKELKIEVMPELDMPGHTRSVVAAYPELACPNADLGPVRTCWGDWGICDDVVCASNPKVLEFYRHVIDETCELFPDAPVNMGGDECTGRQWAKCPNCRAKMKELGFTNPMQLQGWLTMQIQDYVINVKHRRFSGWPDVIENGAKPDPKATVVCVGCGDEQVEAAMKGYDVIVAPLEYCYWDFNQGLKDDPCVYGTWWSGSIPLASVYGFDPTRGIPAAAKKRVLGGEGQNWSEYTYDCRELEWKIWPRAIALSQALWNPQSGYSYQEWFLPVVKRHIAKLRAEGVNCAGIAVEGHRASTGGESAGNQVLEREE